MDRIKSITEAFSMQPVTHSVVSHDQYRDKDSIQRIEKVQYEQYKWHYVGYNFDGEKLFEYLKDSVNVHYFVSPTPL